MMSDDMMVLNTCVCIGSVASSPGSLIFKPRGSKVARKIR